MATQVTLFIKTRSIAASTLVDLRHQILRFGLPRETAIFDGDNDPDTLHFGAYLSDELVGCLTLMRNPFNEKPAWQLRGMAVEARFQGRGVGAELMKGAIGELKRRSTVRQLWCNARVPAIGFYEKLGWRIDSEVFEVPTAGPHVKMVRSL